MSVYTDSSAPLRLDTRPRWIRCVGVCALLVALVFQSAVWASQSCHAPRSVQTDGDHGHASSLHSHAHTHDVQSTAHGHEGMTVDQSAVHNSAQKTTDPSGDGVAFHKCPVCAACCLFATFPGGASTLYPLDYRSPGPDTLVMRAPPFPLGDPPFHPPRGVLAC